MVVKINNKHITISWNKFLYFLVFLAYFLYLLSELNYNTAFVDEAIYATVGEEVLRGIYWENAISWMGGSYIYPIFASLVNRYWGLVGIRFFSVLNLMVSGLVASYTAKILGGRKAMLITALLFLFSANTLNIGQLGTYDAPALMFMSLALFASFRSRYATGSPKRYLWAVISGLTAVIAVLIKYIMIFFIPFIAILILYKNGKFFFRQTAIWLVVFYLILSYFVLNNLESLYDFFANPHFSEPSGKLNILKEIFVGLNIVIPTTFISIFIATKNIRGEKKFLIILLTLAGLMPIFYHLGANNIRSIWKHLVFSLFFLAPTAGWLFSLSQKKLTSVYARKTTLTNATHLSISALILVLMFGVWFAFTKHWEFQRSWPSATKTLSYLQKIRKPDDKIFAEASAVYKYHMFTGFEDPSAWASTWWLEYEGVQGTEGMKLAIRDRAFDIVVLNGYFTSYINQEIDWDLRQNYDLAFSDSYSVLGQYNYETKVWVPKNTNGFNQFLAEAEERDSGL